MAKINENLLVKGARGNMAKQFVYKKRGDETHMARMPRINKDAVATDKQEQVRELFSAASQYAQGAISNPDLKKEYQKKANAKRTAFNVAFRDFLKAPVVKSIDAKNYDGSVGSTIGIKAKDDFRVAGVKLSIRNAAGALIEEGDAVLNPVNLNQWVYTVTQANAAVTGSQISAIARDLPGNTGSLAITV